MAAGPGAAGRAGAPSRQWRDRGGRGRRGRGGAARPRQRRRIMSYPLVIRLMLAMTLMPDASYREALARLAGLLADIPFIREWHAPTGKVVTDWRLPVPPGLLEDLFWQAAGPLTGDDEPSAVMLAGMPVGAADGMLVSLADTPANRAFFGSTGTADDSAPFPHLKIVAVTVRAGRAMLGAILGRASAGEACGRPRPAAPEPAGSCRRRGILHRRPAPGHPVHGIYAGHGLIVAARSRRRGGRHRPRRPAHPERPRTAAPLAARKKHARNSPTPPPPGRPSPGNPRSPYSRPDSPSPRQHHNPRDRRNRPARGRGPWNRPPAPPRHAAISHVHA